MEQDEGLLAKLLKEIAELEIQQALYLKLEKEGYKFLGDIVIRTEAELLAHSRWGAQTLRGVKEILENEGMSLGMKLDEAFLIRFKAACGLKGLRQPYKPQSDF